MSETTSTNRWHLSASGAGVALLAIISCASPPSIVLSNASPQLVRGSMTFDITSSRSGYLPGETMSWKEVLAAKIKSIRGKYREVLTPSEEYAKRKTAELVLEG
jgi:hypothetical protein